MRKKTFSLLLTVAALSMTAIGQTEKGTTLFGASFTTGFAKHKTPLLDFTARGGYFLTNNLMIGAESNFNHYRVKPDFYSNSEISAGLLGRYYFKIKESRFRPFVEAGGGFGRNWGYLNLSQPNGELAKTPYAGNFTYLKAAAGVSCQLNKNLSLEATIDRRYYPFVSHPFGESRFRVGVNFHLPGKSRK